MLVLLRKPGIRAVRDISVPSLAVLLVLQNYSSGSCSSSVSYYMGTYRRIKTGTKIEKKLGRYLDVVLSYFQSPCSILLAFVAKVLFVKWQTK